MSSSTFTWATVTALGPLRIRLDGDAIALPFTPDSLVDPVLLAVDDRVRCEISNNRALVLGVAGGSAPVDVVPIGVVQWFAGAAAPTADWLIANGAAVSRTTYADLYAALGGASSPYGQGNGTTTFNVPNLLERGILGASTATSIGTVTFANATDTLTRTAHGLVDGARVYFTGGTAPTGLTASTRYFAVNTTANTLQLATTLGGSPINFTSDGSGTRTLFVEDFALGYAGGERAHKLTGPESPNLAINIRRFDGDANDYLGGSNNPYGITTPYTAGGVDYNIAYTGGGDRPHSELGPYLALTPIIKARAAA